MTHRPMNVPKIRKSAIIGADLRGFSEHAEDLAQDVLLKFVSGKGQHQTVDQGVRDAIRAMFGDPRTPGTAVRNSAEISYQQIDKAGLVKQAMNGELEFDQLVSCLKGPERALLCLRWLWGFNVEEIAYCFGVSGSMISQRLNTAHEKLRRILDGDQV